MYSACRNAELSTVQKLLHFDTNVNQADTQGRTPLHIACFRNSLEIMKELLKKNVDVNACDKSGATPLHVACEGKSSEIIRELLQYHAYVNARDKDGRTPLYNACRLGYVSHVEELLKYNADTNIADNSGIRPLQIACQYNRINVVRLLLQHNASTMTNKNNKGQTALDIAFQEKSRSVITVLLTFAAFKNLNHSIISEDTIKQALLWSEKNLPVLAHYLRPLEMDHKIKKYESMLQLIQECHQACVNMNTIFL